MAQATIWRLTCVEPGRIKRLIATAHATPFPLMFNRSTRFGPKPIQWCGLKSIRDRLHAATESVGH